MNTSSCTDIFIIGGGINGTGIAADAAGRGCSVILCEQDDLASGTSSASTKLIHGGLRYLEHYEFSLVRKALKEREVLLAKAPHIIQALDFIMPYQKQLRPAWLIRLGLFLYDYLGGRRRLKSAKRIKFSNHPSGEPLQAQFKKGFRYSDCWADDARLVVLNAQLARAHGAQIMTRHQFLSAQRRKDNWIIAYKDLETNQVHQTSCKILVNASGPWVWQIQKNINIPTECQLALVKGSHIVVPKLYEGDFCYMLQNTDKRIIFVIPYQQKYSLIGTTEVQVDIERNWQEKTVSQNEIDYLCAAVNAYFKKTISGKDIVWQYSGIRPLKQENTAHASELTRDYSLELNEEGGYAPLLSIIGGKITTFRRLAEDSMEKIRHCLPHCGPAWTKQSVLPGGNIENADFGLFFKNLITQYPWMPRDLLYRYARLYGTYVHEMLKNRQKIEDLGQNIGADLYFCELKYLIEHEWAKTVDDVLWRRTKIGLEFPKTLIPTLETFITTCREDKLKKNEML